MAEFRLNETAQAHNQFRFYSENEAAKAMSILNVPLPETDVEICTQVVERQSDLQTLIQKVRLCRLKLGALLNRLEQDKLEPDALKLIGERTDEVSNDIRILIETTQWLMDR